jgi:thiamine biosynthesis protein ThiS
MSGMILTINGQPKTIQDGSSLQAAVASLCKNPDLVIAELNGAIIERTQWAATALNANDRLELITFVGGG